MTGAVFALLPSMSHFASCLSLHSFPLFLQTPTLLFSPVAGRVHWCPLAHYLCPMGEGCQTASLPGFRRCCTPLNILNKLHAQSAGQGTGKKSAETKRKQSKEM